MKTFLIACAAMVALPIAAFAASAAQPAPAAGSTPTAPATSPTKPAGDQKMQKAAAGKTAVKTDSKTFAKAFAKTFAKTDAKPADDGKADAAEAAARPATLQADQRKDVTAAKNSATPDGPLAVKTDTGLRHAHWKGGHGATWKIGQNGYGFEASFGGCRYRGMAGPHGYLIKKTC